MHSIPSKTQILVVGGGPAGSYAASALAREGFQVILLEAVQFPRYHIGESLLPSVRPFLDFIDAMDIVKAHGFCSKPGAAVKFNQHKREGYTDFVALNPDNASWNVVRSEFDDILLRHASASGAAVFEQVKVTSIRFKNDDPTNRPIAAEYENKATSETGAIGFDFLVDASGRNGIISQRYLQNRKFNKSVNNVAVWGYWKGCKRYSPGTTRENAIWIEALKDESGWAWFIPLHDGTVSVGVVQDQMGAGAKKRALRDCTGDSTLKSHYLHELKLAPGVLKYIGEEATLVEVGKDGGSGVKQASDFSYSADVYARPGYRLVGDAAAFIDPFFSSGVHLAFTGGLAAAATIASSIRGDTCEEECAKWHDAKSHSGLLLPDDLDRLIDLGDEEAKHKDFASEPINGWTVKTQRGKLGMVIPPAPTSNGR
ncbi:hypothetical protein JB92DRAFT_3103670 [Gautieria morchelliformis]|nr:hypothetical protein JB92DRAFT_3103670 [Gautieria morchelliformis]